MPDLRPPAMPSTLMDVAESRPMRAGDRVFRQGAAASHVYMVWTGAVRLVRYGRAGEEVVLHEAWAGQFFAEASLDATRYHCDAIVMVSGEMLRVPAEPMRRLLQTDAPFARQWASLLARQLRASRARVERLSLRSAAERVHHLLVSEGRGPACEVTLEGTVKDLARSLGLTHESLYRTLARLKAEGVIERGDGFIRLRRRSLGV